VEPEIRLAVDIVFPTWLLLECFAEFSRERPETRIELIDPCSAAPTRHSPRVAWTSRSAAWSRADSS